MPKSQPEGLPVIWCQRSPKVFATNALNALAVVRPARDRSGVLSLLRVRSMNTPTVVLLTVAMACATGADAAQSPIVVGPVRADQILTNGPSGSTNRFKAGLTNGPTEQLAPGHLPPTLPHGNPTPPPQLTPRNLPPDMSLVPLVPPPLLSLNPIPPPPPLLSASIRPGPPTLLPPPPPPPSAAPVAGIRPGPPPPPPPRNLRLVMTPAQPTRAVGATPSPSLPSPTPRPQ